MPRRTALPVCGNNFCTRRCAVLRWSARLLSISVIARAKVARLPVRIPRARSAGGSVRGAIDVLSVAALNCRLADEAPKRLLPFVGRQWHAQMQTIPSESKYGRGFGGPDESTAPVWHHGRRPRKLL